MKKLIIKHGSLILIFIFLFSCKKDESQISKNNFDVSDVEAEQMAIILSKSFKLSNSGIITNKKIYSKDGKNLLHYFQFDKAKCVLIAGDKRVNPLLAFSENPNEYKNESPEFNYFLDHYMDQLLNIKNKHLSNSIDSIWYDLSIDFNQISFSDCSEIPRIIPDNNWHQSAPYNTYGYLLGANRGLVGCSPLALSMVCKKYQFPLSTSGITTYGASGVTYIGDLTSTYNYNQINWFLQPSSPTDEIRETDSLMLNVGLLCKAEYGTYSTSTWYNPNNGTDNYSRGMSGLGFNVEMHYRNSSTEASWINLIKTPLINGSPVLYNGYQTNIGAGHSWVCDGFKTCIREIRKSNRFSGNYFNFKWGWGNNTGFNYYYLNQLAIGSYNFNGHQKIYIPTP